MTCVAQADIEETDAACATQGNRPASDSPG